MNIVDELHEVTAALRTAGVTYAICGGVAVTAYGATTKDIDIVVARVDLAAALAAVAPLGFATRLEELRALDELTRYLHATASET